MSNNKMKGLLKGLRYISQIFDNEKETEMQIGYPTDVKHVAHIGWDGPSETQPNWMNEFTAPPGFSSASSSLNGDNKDKDDASVKSVSEDSSRRGTSAQALSPSPGSPTRDPSELTKSTRRRSSTGAAGEPPARDKSDKPKQRRSARNAANELLGGVKPTRHSKDSNQGSESPLKLPEIPKKTRRKKSKDGGSSVSSRSRSRAQALEADDGAESFSISKSSNKEQFHTSSGLYPFEEGAEKGLTEVS